MRYVWEINCLLLLYILINYCLVYILPDVFPIMAG